MILLEDPVFFATPESVAHASALPLPAEFIPIAWTLLAALVVACVLLCQGDIE